MTGQDDLLHISGIAGYWLFSFARVRMMKE